MRNANPGLRFVERRNNLNLDQIGLGQCLVHMGHSDLHRFLRDNRELHWVDRRVLFSPIRQSKDISVVEIEVRHVGKIRDAIHRMGVLKCKCFGIMNDLEDVPIGDRSVQFHENERVGGDDFDGHD